MTYPKDYTIENFVIHKDDKFDFSIDLVHWCMRASKFNCPYDDYEIGFVCSLETLEKIGSYGVLLKACLEEFCGEPWKKILDTRVSNCYEETSWE